MIPKLGMGEEMAEFMGLWIMTREFIDSDEGQKVLEASKLNVQQNSPELYIKFLDSILRFRKTCTQWSGASLNRTNPSNKLPDFGLMCR
jgi:hypothetical protein